MQPDVRKRKVSWETLVKRLQEYAQLDCTFADYMAMPADRQAHLKDVGFYVGGQFTGTNRQQAELERRCLITLDIDHVDSWDIDGLIETYEDYAFVLHSTAKYSDDTPRLRIIFPLAKDIRPAKYEPIARMLASQFDMDAFDDTTYQPARIMYWPSVTIDGEIFKHHNKGESVDPDAILGEYDDWQDFGEWPHSSRLQGIRKPVEAAEDPLTKAGIVGAFCRTYDIHSAISAFDLPYEPTDFDNRYRPVGSTGGAGAIVYDDVFLYSHHESDVAAQKNLNAFDLVRLHRFEELVSREAGDTPMGDRPSFRAMSQLALESPEVVAETHKEIRGEMDALPDDQGESASQEQPALTFRELRQQLNTIPELERHEREGACDAMIPRIAAARLTKNENSRLAGTLRELYPDPKPTKKSLEDDIKDVGKRLTGKISTETGELADIELLIIQRVLDAHFNGGTTIKRLGKKFWTYENGLWRITDDEWVKSRMLSTITQLRQERPEDAAELVAIVEEGKTSSWLRSLHEMFAAGLAGKENVEDPLGLQRGFSLPIVNCRNCEIHISEDGGHEIRDSEPGSFFTHRIDTDFQKKAKAPEWDRFNQIIWSEASDPAAMQRHLEELGGYVIGMSRWLKTWVLFHGSKDTGKSTVADVLRAMLGNAYLAQDFNAAFGQGKSTFAESNLIGKLALVDDDYDKKFPLPDGFIKKISEEKTLTADIKFGDSLQFKSRALPIVLSNHWPTARDVSDAFRERALVFPFTHRIAGRERDDRRRVAMMKELPGILNKFIRGLKRLRERGDWDIPLDCIEARDQWVRKSNPVAQFAHDCLRRTTMPAQGDIGEGRNVVNTAEVWKSYELWVRGQGGMFMLGRNEFYERLDALLGVRSRGAGRVMYWKGWELREGALGGVSRDEMESWDD